MLITQDFIMLNYPKSGSTYCRNVLKLLSKRRVPLLLRPFTGKNRYVVDEIIMDSEMGLNRGESSGHVNQHAGYSKIPSKYGDRPVMSVVRSPYKRIVSKFNYKHWASDISNQRAWVKEEFPDFPDLDFDTFLRFNGRNAEQKLAKWGMDHKLGQQSITFIRMYAKDPIWTLQNFNEEKIDSGAILNEFANIHFLRQEDLTNELISYLKGFGLTEDEEKMIRSIKRKNVSKKPKKIVLTDEQKAFIRQRERLIFTVLKARGIDYDL